MSARASPSLCSSAKVAASHAAALSCGSSAACSAASRRDRPAASAVVTMPLRVSKYTA